MAADIKKNDDFSKGPISKTVLRLAVPMVLAQFVNVLYNIVDRMYIGHISDTSVDALTGVGVTYANGASVNTSFVTNLAPAQARSAPDLRSELDAAIERLRREKAKALPKYEYPDEVLTAPMLARYSKYGIDFRVGPQECSFTRALIIGSSPAMRAACRSASYCMRRAARLSRGESG